MAARRHVGSAKRSGDDEAMTDARRRVIEFLIHHQAATVAITDKEPPADPQSVN